MSNQKSFSAVRVLALVGLLCIVALPVSAQKGGIIDPPPTAGLQVTFLIHSGLDNPTLTLTDPAQVADLQHRIESVRLDGARVDGEAPEPVLGYNGIMIEDSASLDAEDAVFYVIKDGLLRTDGGLPDDAAARSIQTAGDAWQIENDLIALGLAAGAIDEATLSEIRYIR